MDDSEILVGGVKIYDKYLLNKLAKLVSSIFHKFNLFANIIFSR